MPDDLVKVSIEAAGADEAAESLKGTTSAVEELINSVKLSLGDQRIFSAVLRDNEAAGIELSTTLKELSNSASTVGTAIAQAAQEALNSTQALGTISAAAEQVSGDFYDIAAASQVGQEATSRTAQSLSEASKFYDQFTDSLKATPEATEGLHGFAAHIGEWIEHPLHSAAEMAKGFAEALGPIGIAAAGVVTALIAVGAETLHVADEMATAVRQSENMAEKMGLLVGQAEQLKAEGQLVGVSIGSLSMAARILGQVLEDPTAKHSQRAAEAMNKLGVAVYSSLGQVRPMGEVLLDVLDKLSQVPDDATRAAEGLALLGRGSKELLPLIKNHQELREEVRKLGVGLDEDVDRSLLKVFDSTQKLNIAWEETKKSFAAKIAPVIIPIKLAIAESLTGEGGGPGASARGLFAKHMNDVLPTPSDVKAVFDDFQSAIRAGKDRIIDENVAGDLGKQLSAQFKASLAGTREAQEEELRTVKAAREKLRGELLAGAPVTDTGLFKEKEKEFAQLTAQQTKLETELKKHKENKAKIATEEVDFEAKQAETLIGIRRSYVAAALALDTISKSQELTLLRDLGAEEVAIKQAAIDKKIEIAKKDPDKNAGEIRAEIDKLLTQRMEVAAKQTELDVKTYSEQVAIRRKAIDTEVADVDKLFDATEKERHKEEEATLKSERTKADIRSAAAAALGVGGGAIPGEERGRDAAKAAEMATEAEEKHIRATAEMQKLRVDAELTANLITESQHAAMLKDIEDQEHASILRILNDRLAAIVAGAPKELEERQKILNQIQALEDSHNIAVERINDASLKREEGNWKRFMGIINRDFDSAIGGWVRGTERFSTAWIRMGNEMVSQIIINLANMLLKFAEHEAAVLLLHQATAVAKKGTDEEVAAQSVAISAASAIKEITGAAAKAAAHTYASVSAIPIVGPFLAPPAAAAAFVAVEAFGAMVSAERGGLLSEDSLAFLHKNEMVLPSEHSQTIQNITQNGGVNGGNLQAHFHFIDSHGASMFWSRSKGQIKATLREMMREGSFTR